MSESERKHLKADQLIVDAMLRGRELDTSEAIDTRMERVHEAIAEDSIKQRPRPEKATVSRGSRNWNNVIRAALGGATAVAAVLVVAVLMQTSPVSATDLLQRAHTVETNSAAGDRRYMVTIRPPHQRASLTVVEGILDVRDGKQMRFDLTHPNGTHHIWGFGSDGPWQVTPHGRVIRDGAARWPRWLMGESRALLIDTMPSLLDLVLTGYDASSSQGEDGITTIVATQRDASEGGPDEIIIELDSEQNEVAALELRWAPDSEERWRRKNESGQRPEGEIDGRRRGDRMRRGMAESDGAQMHPRGRNQDARQRPSHPGDHEARRGKSTDRASDRNVESDVAKHDRLERRRDYRRRPGGPPAPRAIRFQRVPAGTISSDWYTGPTDSEPTKDSS